MPSNNSEWKAHTEQEFGMLGFSRSLFRQEGSITTGYSEYSENLLGEIYPKFFFGMPLCSCFFRKKVRIYFPERIFAIQAEFSFGLRNFRNAYRIFGKKLPTARIFVLLSRFFVKMYAYRRLFRKGSFLTKQR